MIRVEVHNQQEFEDCVKAGNIAVVIDCAVVAWDNSSVEANNNVFIRFFSALKIKAQSSVVILKHGNSEAIEGGRQLDVINDKN